MEESVQVKQIFCGNGQKSMDYLYKRQNIICHNLIDIKVEKLSTSRYMDII